MIMADIWLEAEHGYQIRTLQWRIEELEKEVSLLRRERDFEEARADRLSLIAYPDRQG